MKKVIVTKQFRDVDDFSKLYKVGDDISNFDEDRIAYLASKGLVASDEDLGDDEKAKKEGDAKLKAESDAKAKKEADEKAKKEAK